jgi:hypothetical protein
MLSNETPMKGKTMFNTTKNIALLIIDYTGTLGPLMMFVAIFFFVGLYSY